MPRRQLAALILASALITLDGTATNIALPAIGRDLSASMSRLQWVANAPLLMLAAMLLPAGAIADRFGHARLLRAGVLLFMAASLVCAIAWSDAVVVGAKLVQGASGAFVLPAALAALRTAYDDAAERTRIFGLWAAWTGAASAVGPLLAGLLVDVMSWRAVFVPSIAAALVSVALLKKEPPVGVRVPSGPVPGLATGALMVMLGAFAYLTMQAARSGLNDTVLILPAALAVAAGVTLARDPHREVLFPRDLIRTRNCLHANATSFALYFGLFGLTFLVVLYVQQVLHHSALSAAAVVLPISVMLLLAGRFGRLTSAVGTKWLVVGGALLAAGGLAWIASASQPVPLWSRLIFGTTAFGLGLSIAVPALTHAAVAAVPDEYAGAASALNHAVVRAGGLIAIAVLGSIAAPGASDVVSPEGFQRAMLLCAVVVAAGGVAASARLRDDEAGGVTSRR
jgi:MFS family permease